jgi:hypothetical protein
MLQIQLAGICSLLLLSEIVFLIQELQTQNEMVPLKKNIVKPHNLALTFGTIN